MEISIFGERLESYNPRIDIPASNFGRLLVDRTVRVTAYPEGEEWRAHFAFVLTL